MKTSATKLIAIPLFLIALAGCDARVETSSVAEQFTITNVKPPKRLYVDVVDKDGRSYNVYVSKRCSNWQDIVIGSKVTLERTTHRYESGRTETGVNVRSSSDVCPH